MQYFSNFPKTLFLVRPAGYQTPAEYVALTDITRNVRFKKEVIDNITLYETYNIKDGDTPELIAEKLYGSPHYHWVIMLLNDRYDYINDFPMQQKVFDDYINKKYDSVVVAGAPYLQAVYGTSSEGLIVDLVKDRLSVEIEGNYRLINRATNQAEFRDIRSVWHTDSVLNIKVKKFMYTDHKTAGSYTVDLSKWRVDFGTVPGVSVITALAKELEENAKKARIKVISKQMLDRITSDFRELM